MKRYIILVLVVFLAAFGCIFWMIASSGEGHSGDEVTYQEAYRLLHQEAKLVEYFCLNRIPPVVGPATIPKEWEQALGSSIRVREGVGEAVSESPALSAKASDVQTLSTGQSVAATDHGDNGVRHSLVYKPASSGTLLLVLSKSDATARDQMQLKSSPNPWLMSALMGLVIAMIAGVTAKLVFRPARREQVK